LEYYVPTAPPSMPAPARVLRFENVSGSAPNTGAGLSLDPDEVRRFYLPFQQAQPDEVEQTGKRSQILMVEDNLADVRLVREALEEHGVQCELVVITDGERAIRFIQSLDAGDTPLPDLAILDLNLPKKSGIDVLRQLRAGGRCSRIPVTVLSSSDHPTDKNEAFRFGASRYLRKPPRLAEFMSLGRVFKEMLEGEPKA